MHKRAIIIAAGKETRWDNYLGINKHFIEIDGEKILHRTVRLLNEAGIDDVWVVGKDEQYDIHGSKLFIPKFTPEYHDADKFLSSSSLWLDNGKTHVIYGDCYFTKEAIDEILDWDIEGWFLFGRGFVSRLTGNCGECFAQTFFPGQVAEHVRALYKLIDYYNSGRLGRIGGWEHYRIMIDLPEEIIHKQLIGDRFVNIDDWTDDFDTPEFYEIYRKRKNDAERHY